LQCRFCETPLHTVFVDLGYAPASNSYLNKEDLHKEESTYPLKVYVCKKCKLVQLDECKKSDDIFNKEYAYFSSFSSSWLQHAKSYVEEITKKLSLNSNSLVTEIASNDGYLLQYFQEKNIPCIGVEPSLNTAAVAKEKGIEVIEKFFTQELALTMQKSDLILGNNVLAHVPDINGFVRGLKQLLKEKGTITMEFPHLLNLIEQTQFDTIYHEHFSYFSFFTVQKIFEYHELKIYDVETLKTHGGSLRIYATHRDNKCIKTSKNVRKLLEEEKQFGLFEMDIYAGFQTKVDAIRSSLISFLTHAKIENKRVIAYGAAAKGNTLLNYSDVKSDSIEFVIDKSPYKVGKYMPASHIPILDETLIRQTKPDYILILPWNIKDEIISQLAYAREWDAQFLIAIPHIEVL
jgi:SAM-dependent methyltransferase